jgi:urease accessory protein
VNNIPPSACRDFYDPANSFSKDPSNPIPAHALLLLADSALPLGGFAYSNGLESYLAHLKLQERVSSPAAAFDSFLTISIASMASTSLPYLLAAYREPDMLETIDNDFDASTPCVVAQRASLAQGRALLGVWERSFRMAYIPPTADAAATAIKSLESFFNQLKSRIDPDEGLGPNGHLAPLWAVVCRAMGLSAQQTAYLYMLNHAKGVVSAAVRSSVIGPYKAQLILASQRVQETIAHRIEREWDTPVDRAGQLVPTLDLWVGRHELLYSRIFNS